MVTKTRKQAAESETRNRAAKKAETVTPSKPVSSNGSSPSSQETLRHLYTSLLRCRLVQEEARRASGSDYDLAIGHEAIIAGPTSELGAEDTIATSGRNLAGLVARGMPLASLLAKSTSDRTARPPLLPPSMPQDPFN